MCEVPNSMNRIEDPEPINTNKLLAQAITEDIFKGLKDLGYYVGQEIRCKDSIFDTKAEIYRIVLERLNNGVEV